MVFQKFDSQHALQRGWKTMVRMTKYGTLPVQEQWRWVGLSLSPIELRIARLGPSTCVKQSVWLQSFHCCTV